MSPSGVGFAFTLLVLGREGYHLWRPWHRARIEAREECDRHGHVWGKEFESMGGKHRNCDRCKRQQHWTGGDWL